MLDSPAIPPAAAPDADDAAPLAEGELGRLKWRCRRGLLENDLFVQRFFERHEADLTAGRARALQALMDLADNDLLDLLLARREPEGALARPAVIEVLGMMRARPTAVPTCRPADRA